MNNIDFHGIEEIWSSLSTSSLLWLTVTLAAYLFADGYAYALSDILFGRPVHSLFARTDNGSAGRAAL